MLVYYDKTLCPDLEHWKSFKITLSWMAKQSCDIVDRLFMKSFGITIICHRNQLIINIILFNIDSTICHFIIKYSFSFFFFLPPHHSLLFYSYHFNSFGGRWKLVNAPAFKLTMLLLLRHPPTQSIIQQKTISFPSFNCSCSSILFTNSLLTLIFYLQHLTLIVGLYLASFCWK